MMLLIMLDSIIMVLVSVAFLTLLERKILSYIQLRKGPNKVGFIGLLQPFSDAIKLFTKENFLIFKSNYYMYMLSPLVSMMLMMLLWINMPYLSEVMNNSYSFLMVMCLLSMGVYPLMVSGWSSNSIYSMIGSMRSIAQTISYEVSMILLMLSFIFLIESYNLIEFMKFQKYLYFFIFLFPLMLILFISLLAELNRTPFDLAEGESELVSGFNTEYMSGLFAMIFISEYGMIMFMMYLFNLMSMGGNIYSILFYLMYMYLLFLVIWVRGTYPRMRYDSLMNLTWMSYLPISLNYLIILINIKWILLM
uniref:NADH-ubiquinone oxidoreductase chain 1 n=1 Tax=Philotrypesis sp. JHX-2011 TaxID=1035792 RepID=G8EEJ6_9HYME|nr:NADH dehydrogenase subunit 1 [Philotrypesis sp. JHX-2011]